VRFCATLPSTPTVSAGSTRSRARTRGAAIPNAALDENLVRLFRSWSKVIGRHGMLVVELHDPELVIPGQTLTNYRLTHGLSDQLTVSLERFLRAAEAAGLRASSQAQRIYPSDPARATISINHFRPLPVAG
jgi:hypothetical protein